MGKLPVVIVISRKNNWGLIIGMVILKRQDGSQQDTEELLHGTYLLQFYIRVIPPCNVQYAKGKKK